MTSDASDLSSLTIIDTSLYTTNGTNLAIGETITYRLAMTFIEGTLPNTQLQLTVDNGIGYSSSSINYGANIGSSTNPTNPSI